MAGDVPEDADDAAGRQGCFRVVEFGREGHPQLSGHSDEGRYQALAQAAQGLADYLRVRRPFGYRMRLGAAQLSGSRGVAREKT